MQLIIAEKPKMAKAIARAIGASPDPKVRGAYENAEYRVVSCEGHILEAFTPEQYDERYKQWRVEDLPIHPDTWQLGIIQNKGRYITMIRDSMKRADTVISAGDPDAEGQMLVDEVIHYLNWTGRTLRLIINDLNPAPIQKAMQHLEDNNSEKFQGLYRKALSRSRGDWLLGMNLTRFYTVMGRQFGIDHVLSAGRVQSAVLGLVVRRDLEIESFVPHDYFAVTGEFQHANGDFTAKWVPGEQQQGLDSSDRLISPEVAEALRGLAPGKAEIIEHDTQRKRQNPPKPYSMSDLQKEASKKLGLTMAQTLDIAQALYDKHEIITYPRTDTGYLPEAQHADGPTILAAIQQNLGSGAEYATGANPDLKSGAFNDSKVKAHHGIIPTARTSQQTIQSLSRDERAIYDMVCRRYAAQFFPAAEYNSTRVVACTQHGAQHFRVNGKAWLVDGWRATLPAPTASSEQGEEGDTDDEETSNLPTMAKGDIVTLSCVSTTRKQTTPPKHFTDASLLDAMTNIHRFVENDAIRSMLKEGDGIGTEATRADIVEKLVKHQLILRDKKLIKSTPAGKTHYHLMPPALTTPDMAGVFENSTRQIEEGELPIDQFLIGVDEFVRDQLRQQEHWIQRAKELGLRAPKASPCRNCEAPLSLMRTKTKKTFFLCRQCECLFQNDSGVPGYCFKGPLKEQDDADREAKRQERKKTAPPCPECQAPILQSKSAKTKKLYWRCDDCNSWFQDHGGKVGAAFIVRGEKVELKPDGPACPECESAMLRAMTKKKQPIHICRQCDSMFWSNDGQTGNAFKLRGKMVVRRSVQAAEKSG